LGPKPPVLKGQAPRGPQRFPLQGRRPGKVGRLGQAPQPAPRLVAMKFRPVGLGAIWLSRIRNGPMRVRLARRNWPLPKTGKWFQGAAFVDLWWGSESRLPRGHGEPPIWDCDVWWVPRWRWRQPKRSRGKRPPAKVKNKAPSPSPRRIQALKCCPCIRAPLGPSRRVANEPPSKAPPPGPGWLFWGRTLQFVAQGRPGKALGPMPFGRRGKFSAQPAKGKGMGGPAFSAGPAQKTGFPKTNLLLLPIGGAKRERPAPFLWPPASGGHARRAGKALFPGGKHSGAPSENRPGLCPGSESLGPPVPSERPPAKKKKPKKSPGCPVKRYPNWPRDPWAGGHRLSPAGAKAPVFSEKQGFFPKDRARSDKKTGLFFRSRSRPPNWKRNFELQGPSKRGLPAAKVANGPRTRDRRIFPQGHRKEKRKVGWGEGPRGRCPVGCEEGGSLPPAPPPVATRLNRPAPMGFLPLNLENAQHGFSFFPTPVPA